jgi:hypothetical protein
LNKAATIKRLSKARVNTEGLIYEVLEKITIFIVSLLKKKATTTNFERGQNGRIGKEEVRQDKKITQRV